MLLLRLRVMVADVSGPRSYYGMEVRRVPFHLPSSVTPCRKGEGAWLSASSRSCSVFQGCRRTAWGLLILAFGIVMGVRMALAVTVLLALGTLVMQRYGLVRDSGSSKEAGHGNRDLY